MDTDQTESDRGLSGDQADGVGQLLSQARVWVNVSLVTWLSATLAAGGAVALCLDSWIVQGWIVLCMFWFGLVGALIIPTVGLVFWMICPQRWPRVQACIAGSATGIVSPFDIVLVPAVVGGFAAVIGVSMFIRFSAIAYPIREAEQLRKEGKLSPPRYSISDLFARMTVAAILIVVWTTVLSWGY